jgi:CoA:oxalate CoA-transferase
MLLTTLSRRLYTDRPVGRVGNRHPETYPVDSFATCDGEIVLVGYSDAIVKRIYDAMEKPELADDPRFKTNRDRNAHEAELRKLIADWTKTRPRQEVLAKLQAVDVPVAPIWSLDDLLASGHVAARGLLQPGTNTKLGATQLVPQPVRFSETDKIAPMRSPVLGEDTDNVLQKELGLDDAAIRRLRAAKAI